MGVETADKGQEGVKGLVEPLLATVVLQKKKMKMQYTKNISKLLHFCAAFPHIP